MKIWIVVKYWQGGKRENYGAYSEENNAREIAGKIIGQDGALIALETIDLDGTPEPIVRLVG